MKKHVNKALLVALMIGMSNGAMADHKRQGHQDHSQNHSQDHNHRSRPGKVVQAPSIDLDFAVERARAKGHRVLKATTRTRPNGKQVHVLKVRTPKGVVKRIIIR